MGSPRASRPKFAGSRSSRPTKARGLVPWEWAVEQLEVPRNYWLATTRADGSPHVMPLWGAWLDGVLYFDAHPDSQKVRNLRHQPRGVVHLESGGEVVIFEGSVDVEEETSRRGSCSSGSPPCTSRSNRPFRAFGFRAQIGDAWRAAFTGSAT